MPDFRHHVAHPVVVLVPFESGSPKSAREVKPREYPAQRREHWRPATRPPSKAAATKRLIDSIVKQDQDIRAFMADARRSASHG
jgi:hypothetical protein